MANSHSIDLELSSSQYLSITDAAQTGLDITGDFTIEAWVKVEQLPSVAGTSYAIVTKFDYASNQASYQFSIDTSNKLFVVFDDIGDASDLSRFRTDSAAVQAGVWKHVAVSCDVSAPSAVFYVNGAPVASSTELTGSTAVFNGTSIFYVGRREDGLYYDGLIDEVRVWNDIRTAQEIADNYQNELVGNEAGLVGYWKLNNSLLDETTNNNDLTNNNSAVFSTDIPDWPSGIPSGMALLGVGNGA